MDAKSLFNLHRALAQPVKMCMLDFPVTILDDLVSSADASFPPRSLSNLSDHSSPPHAGFARPLVRLSSGSEGSCLPVNV